jgi:hypothetical protein
MIEKLEIAPNSGSKRNAYKWFGHPSPSFSRD